jgi:diadenosine tetraphosphatase ApaH/serine/threonine PP2A family protein phosphatase
MRRTDVIVPESKWIEEQTVQRVLAKVRDILEEEPACLELAGEFVVVGDIHGDIDTLLRIFNKKGHPPDASYVFLGDYVDRGQFSCEVVFLLFALKVMFPDKMHLIRGNHECRSVTKIHGFRKECIDAFSLDTYNLIMNCFDELPILAVLNNAVLCVHGGIPKKVLDSLDSVMKVRGKSSNEVSDDILWSDPDPDIEDFEESSRGRGHLYGKRACLDFLKRHQLQFLIRSHQLCVDGYDYPFGPDGRVLTIFSSCDYCGLRNDCGIVQVSAKRMDAEYFCPMKKDEIARRRILIPSCVLDWRIRTHPCTDVLVV